MKNKLPSLVFILIFVLGIVIILGSLKDLPLRDKWNIEKEIVKLTPIEGCVEKSRTFREYKGFTSLPSAWIIRFDCKANAADLYKRGSLKLTNAGYTAMDHDYTGGPALQYSFAKENDKYEAGYRFNIQDSLEYDRDKFNQKQATNAVLIIKLRDKLNDLYMDGL